MARRVDHVALLVRDTEAPLRLWRDVLALEVVTSESGADPAVHLTNLRLGPVELQLVEAAVGHRLAPGPGEPDSVLDHLALADDDLARSLPTAQAAGLVGSEATIVPATRGRRALFLDRHRTDGVLVELLEVREDDRDGS